MDMYSKGLVCIANHFSSFYGDIMRYVTSHVLAIDQNLLHTYLAILCYTGIFMGCCSGFTGI